MSFEEPFTKDFVSKSEQRVCICIDDFGELIRVKDAEQTEVGRFEMQLADDSYYYLRWMHLDITDPSYVHQGIGRAALQFHKEIFDLPIYASEDDGLTKEDGSELTGDAPAFVKKMKAEGLIEFSHIDHNDNEIDDYIDVDD